MCKYNRHMSSNKCKSRFATCVQNRVSTNCYMSKNTCNNSFAECAGERVRPDPHTSEGCNADMRPCAHKVTHAPHTRTDLLLTWPCKRVAAIPYLALRTCSRSTFTWNWARVESQNAHMAYTFSERFFLFLLLHSLEYQNLHRKTWF